MTGNDFFVSLLCLFEKQCQEEDKCVAVIT